MWNPSMPLMSNHHYIFKNHFIPPLPRKKDTGWRRMFRALCIGRSPRRELSERNLHFLVWFEWSQWWSVWLFLNCSVLPLLGARHDCTPQPLCAWVEPNNYFQSKICAKWSTWLPGRMLNSCCETTQGQLLTSHTTAAISALSPQGGGLELEPSSWLTVKI